MKVPTILAFDPGETTGWCALSAQGKLRGFGQFPLSTRVVTLLRRFKPQLVIVERFALYPHQAKAQIGSTFKTVEVIGVIRHECARLGLKMQEQPATLMEFFKRRGRLKHYLPQIRSEHRHAQAAARHLLYYLVFEVKVLPLPPRPK